MQRVISVAVLAVCLYGSTVQGQVGKNETVLNPNRAGTEQLSALAQLDSALVDGIVARRPFIGMEAFDAYLGFDLGGLSPSRTVCQALRADQPQYRQRRRNETGAGVGKRMAHEFEEYRPYKSMDQWRREIGKYVDDDELARLEQYVFVPLELNSASEADFLTIPG